MNRIAALVIALVAICSCTRDRVVLRQEDGLANLEYDCAGGESQLDRTEGVRVIGEYGLRLANHAGSHGDSATAARLRLAYANHEWEVVESVALKMACEDGPLASTPTAFPAPLSQSPGFRLPALDGGTNVALEDLRGRIVVLDFWATWCKPCIRKMPALVALARRFPERLTVVAILHEDTPANARGWLADNPAGAVLHVLDADKQVAADYRVLGLPTVYVLDQQGRVLPSPADPRFRMSVDELSQRLLSESNTAPPQ